MKKLILFSVTFFLMQTWLYAQDVIIFKNGDEIKSKVVEIGISEIKYRKFDNPEGPVISVNRSEVFIINYENGTKDVISNDNKTSSVNSGLNDLFFKGQKDAEIYYKGYKGAGTGTLITSLFSPLAGLIPAIACSSTPPKAYNLNYPNAELFNKADYQNGYKLRAKKIKSAKVWTNWGIGLGVNIIAVAIILSNSNN